MARQRVMGVAAGVGWVVPALITLITVATFLPSLPNGFVFDDSKNFVANPHYRGLGWTQVKWMFTTLHMGHYMPFTWLTLGLDYVLWGMNPAGYHLTSLLLHAATAVAFYFVARRLLRLGAGGSGDDQALRVGAAIAALLFAVHPLRVESVVWVTERRDVLSGLFYLGTILAYLRACEREERGRGWYRASVALFVCALLSKSMAVSLPVVLLILDVYPLGRLGGTTGWWGGRARRVYAEKIPFVVLALAASAVAFVALIQLSNTASLDRLNVLGRLAISAYSLGFYLWKTIAPFNLSPLYELPAEVDPWAAPFLASYGAVVAMTVLVLAVRRRVPSLAAAGLAYVVILLPVLGIIQNGPQIAADRYTYLSCLGWAVLAGGGLVWIWRRLTTWRANAWPLVPLVALPVVLSLQVVTVYQIRVWRDPVTLWRHAITLDPSSAVAHYNLGGALLDAGRLDEATAAFQKAVEWMPDTLPITKASFEFTLGTVLQKQGDLEGAEFQYRRALTLEPSHYMAWNNLGVILAIRGEIAAALAAFQAALRTNPAYRDACANARHAAKLLEITPPEIARCPQG